MNSFSKTPEPRTHHAMTGPVSGAKSLPSATSSSISVQAKLEMTEPGDSYEMEADAMAELAISRASSHVSGNPNGSALTSSLAPASMVSRLPSGHSSVTVTPAIESAISSSRGGGFALPATLKGQMESGFGADFSDVRLHTGTEAASLSSSIQAKAFTSGKDIYFNEGQFNPDSVDGQKIIAHELAHTLQQSGMVARITSSEENEEASKEKPSSESIKTRKEEIINLINAGFSSYEVVQMIEFAIENPKTSPDSTNLPFLNSSEKSTFGGLYIRRIQKKVRGGVDVETIRSNRRHFVSTYFAQDKMQCDKSIKLATAGLIDKGITPHLILKCVTLFLDGMVTDEKGFASLLYAIDHALSIVMTPKDVLKSVKAGIEDKVYSTVFRLYDKLIKKEVSSLLDSGISQKTILQRAADHIDSKTNGRTRHDSLEDVISIALKTATMTPNEALSSVRTGIEYQATEAIIGPNSSLSQAAGAYREMQQAKDDGGLVYQVSRSFVGLFNEDEIEEINRVGKGSLSMYAALRSDNERNDYELKSFKNEFFRVFGIEYNADKVADAENAFKEYSVKLAAISYQERADKLLTSSRSDARMKTVAISIATDRRIPASKQYYHNYDPEEQTKNNILNRIGAIFNTDAGKVLKGIGCDIDSISATELEQIVVPVIRNYLEKQKNAACGGKSLETLEKVYRNKSKLAYGSVLSDAVSNAKDIMFVTKLVDFGLNVGIGIALGVCGGALAGVGARAFQLGTTGTKIATVASNAGVSLAFDLIVDPSVRKTKLAGSDYGFAILSAALGAAIDFKTFKSAKSFTKEEMEVAAKNADDAAQAVTQLDRDLAKDISNAKTAYNANIAIDTQLKNEQAFISKLDAAGDKASQKMQKVDDRYTSDVEEAGMRQTASQNKANAKADEAYQSLKLGDDTAYLAPNQAFDFLVQDRRKRAAIKRTQQDSIGTSMNRLRAETAEALERRVRDGNKAFAELQRKAGVPLTDGKPLTFNKDTIEYAENIMIAFAEPIRKKSAETIAQLKSILPEGDKAQWRKTLSDTKKSLKETHSVKRKELVQQSKAAAAEYRKMFIEQHDGINRCISSFKTMALYFAKTAEVSSEQKDWFVQQFIKSLDITNLTGLDYDKLIEIMTTTDTDLLMLCIIYDSFDELL